MRGILSVVLGGSVLWTCAPGLAEESGLLGHWTFDEVVGGVVQDSSPAGRRGQVHGAALTGGVRDRGLEFDGKDDYVFFGDLGAYEAITISFWLRWVEPAGEDFQALVSSDGWEEGLLHVTLRSGKVETYLHMGQSRRGRVKSDRLESGVWHHVAVIADRRQKSLRLFINGEQTEQDDISPLSTPIKLTRLVAGRGFDGKGPSRYFRGALDDVRIYGRPLLPAEIAGLCPDKAHPRTRDWRNIQTGYPIPDENYCDQPYVVVTKEGSWVSLLTTGPGHESEPGQHVVATISADQGRTWSPLIDIEPSGEIESSWVVPLITPYGRIYAFYNYNGDRIRNLPRPPYTPTTLGWYVFKYSDDGGQTWSKQRYRLPMRLTACDRANDWQGKVQMFWGIDKPNLVGSDVVFAFTKLGRHMLELGEGWVFRSSNLLTERDPAKIQWQLLPEGEHGIRAEEFGSVQEEHNIVPLSDGSLYCVYRTTQGHPCHSYSRDGGRTWSKPEPMTYSPGGRRIKHPRACPMLWRTQDGRYLFWFHNHGGQSYEGRNPVWIAGGVEREGRIHWSQPEILLYDPDPNARMSYPDLIEQDGRYWVSETQKTIARIHPIDKTLLEGLWTQGQIKEVSRKGLLLDADAQQIAAGEAELPGPIDLGRTGGLTVEVWVRFRRLEAGQVLLDCRQRNGAGIRLAAAEQKTVRLELSDGRRSAAWDADPGVLQPGKLHHIVAIVDDGPRVICFVVDGRLCDGGEERQFGWGRYSSNLGDVSGAQKQLLGVSLEGQLLRVRLYGRPLRISEAAAHFHAGP